MRAGDEAAFASALVDWFGRHARVLPWRERRTPYRVWVSEVMLQQTRVATVIPYFERFVARFPDVASLAAAEVSDVLALWSGLGYYRRARALHAGAREVVARFGGELPGSVEALRSIGGIGAYTAGAIASLAFGLRAPIVDGNVARVYARVFAIRDDVKSTPGQKALWSIAAGLVPASEPGRFNEALMELGATVCVPRDPMCLVCPVRAHCTAYADGAQDELPVVAKKKEVPSVYAAALVAREGGRVLLARRRADALFGGLWEPPTVESDRPGEAARALARLAPRARPCGEVTHTLSHRRMVVSVFAAPPPGPAAVYPPIYEEARAVAEGEFAAYGISSLARKILALVPADVAKAPRVRRAPAGPGPGRTTPSRTTPSRTTPTRAKRK